MPLPLEQIGTVDPRRLDSDEHFSRTRPGNRRGPRDPDEDLSRTGPGMAW